MAAWDGTTWRAPIRRSDLGIPSLPGVPNRHSAGLFTGFDGSPAALWTVSGGLGADVEF
jgi:hypothetical protein